VANGFVIQPSSGVLRLQADAPNVIVGGASAMMGVARTRTEVAKQESPHDLQTTTVPQLVQFPTISAYPHHINPLPLEIVVAGCAVVVSLGAGRVRWQSWSYFRL
jgi:hypothetical protein